jgi:hypothetical protein
MRDRDIDWKRNDEHYQYAVLGHYAVFERPDRKPEHCSPMQRVTREIKKLRGERYWDHIEGDGHRQLPTGRHESWFQLPAPQKEELMLRRVDWSGVSENTRDQLISAQFRSRDGEINAQDEYRLHDQLTRVERSTPHWSELSSTAKLEKLLHGPGVDWRPFPPEFQAVALGYMIRREVKMAKEGFEIVGVFDGKGDYRHFGRSQSSGRGGFEQSRDKGPKRPVFSKATARDSFRWAVQEPRYEAFLKHGDGDLAAFSEQLRPLWRDFWAAAKQLDREGLSKLTHEWSLKTDNALQQQQPPLLSSDVVAIGSRDIWPSEIALANKQQQRAQGQGKSNGNENANGHDHGHSM